MYKLSSLVATIMVATVGVYAQSNLSLKVDVSSVKYPLDKILSFILQHQYQGEVYRQRRSENKQSCYF